MASWLRTKNFFHAGSRELKWAWMPIIKIKFTSSSATVSAKRKLRICVRIAFAPSSSWWFRATSGASRAAANDARCTANPADFLPLAYSAFGMRDNIVIYYQRQRTSGGEIAHGERLLHAGPRLQSGLCWGRSPSMRPASSATCNSIRLPMGDIAGSGQQQSDLMLFRRGRVGGTNVLAIWPP